jgi:DNA-binding NtrC family response regulator/tetratricopeptide (TPR) repeat protein
MTPPLHAIRVLEHAEQLLSRGRCRDAFVCTGRLRSRSSVTGEPAARWRTIRARALWALGSAPRARAEALRALREAQAGETRAHALNVLAQIAWHAGAVAEALARLRDAEEASSVADISALRLRGHILRDAGRLDEALAACDQALQMATETGDGEAEAEARADRGTLLAALGRWSEARGEVESAARLFRERGDARELTVAGVARAVLELSNGDLGGARPALERARAMCAAQPEAPRAFAEVLLLLSDLHLAAGENARAETCSREALGLFTVLRERRGECWGRVRRVHALLALGRREEALREAQRAVRETAGSGLAVEAWALLALGRVLLRTERSKAASAFSEAVRCRTGRRDLQHAALFGEALARGVGSDDPQLRRALEGLAVFGDRRILSLCLADARELLGPDAPAPGGDVGARPVTTPAFSEARALVDAARVLAGGDSLPARWAGAMRAVQAELPWWRVALVGDPGLELRRDLREPQSLSAADPARKLAAESNGPMLVAVETAGFSRDPVQVLHDVRLAAIAPVAPGYSLYADFRELAQPERATAFLGEVARLLGPHVESGLPVSCDAEEPPGCPGILGRCAAMRALCAEIARIAGTSLGVHIEGETGTGKERVARALHEASSRARRPFVAVNASSLNDELFESEVFGHVRGAFTGAVANRDGYVAEAEGGTLFLDEVADLTPRAQAKLLRFLQEREYRRLGESVTRKADVRILTAANVSLAERVAAGLYREDLMYRLVTLTLRLPPLRERGSDILLLARHFLEVAARRDRRPVPRPSAELVRVLTAYPWPGNVRQLEQEMTRLALFATSEVVGPEHLSGRLQGSAPARAPVSLREALLDHERHVISRALERHDGNRARTAVALGITRQALLLKMRRLGIG